MKKINRDEKQKKIIIMINPQLLKKIITVIKKIKLTTYIWNSL